MAKKRSEGPEAIGGTVYLKHTMGGGGSYITEHRVWDANLFVAKQFEANQAVNESRKKGEPQVKLGQVTEADYKAQQKESRRGH